MSLYTGPMDQHTPRMTSEREKRLLRWHEDTSTELRLRTAHDIEYLGERLHVPEDVFPPQEMAQIFGRAIQDEVKPGERVLDMGTGSGVNAILAARQGADVLAIDVNPSAVAAAQANAVSGGLIDRIECRLGDLFDGIDERFDLIIFDPPFRWFEPADMLDRAFTDFGYTTLRTFFAQVCNYLKPDGRVMMFFATTADVDYFRELADNAGLDLTEINTADLIQGDEKDTYFAFRLTSRPK